MKKDHFGICDELGGHSWCCCCTNRIKVTDMAKAIGVGPTLFLMSTKSLACLFFILTIINIPVYMFYFNSNPASNTISTPQDYFNAMSLGNIGESTYSCDISNWAKERKLTLSCDIGTLAEFRYLGLQN